MPLPLPPQPQLRRISTAARVYPAPPHFSTHTPLPNISSSSSQTPTNSKLPKVGRLGRWTVPTLTLMTVAYLSSPVSPLRRTDEDAHAFKPRNYSSASPSSSAQRDSREERNQQVMDAYGDRMSLADLEKALEAYEVR